MERTHSDPRFPLGPAEGKKNSLRPASIVAGARHAGETTAIGYTN